MHASLIVLLLLVSLPLQAIEKCVTAEGKTLYSDTPCPSTAKRVGNLDPVPPPDARAQQRIDEEQERLQRQLDRLERKETQEREQRALRAEEERAAARQAEREAQERRRTEALERQAREAPVYVVPQPVYVQPRPHPPRVRPPSKPEKEEPAYQAAPFPPKKKPQ